jgi:hypothetical protein
MGNGQWAMGNGQWAMGNVPLSIPLPTGFDHTQRKQRNFFLGCESYKLPIIKKI